MKQTLTTFVVLMALAAVPFLGGAFSLQASHLVNGDWITSGNERVGCDCTVEFANCYCVLKDPN